MAAYLTIDPTSKSCVYSPLPDPSHEIRVLDLQPGKWYDHLRGQLRTIHLSSTSPYAALSYTWGVAPSEERLAHRNGCIRIRSNLQAALRRLRQRKDHRTLWIDAVCINQDDEAERTSQIRIMGTIYQRAINVLIWLGEYPAAQDRDARNTRLPHWDTSLLGFGSSVRLNARGRKFSQALENTLAQVPVKWQDRAWVIQEYVLAKHPMLCFGPICVPFDKLHLQDLSLEVGGEMPNFMAFFLKVSDLYKLKVLPLGQNESVHRVLPYVSTASSHLPQDRVYSLLSLIDDREAEMVPIGGSQSVGQVFARTTFAAITARHSLAILELVKLSTPSRYDLPSWAVDFTAQHDPVYGRLHDIQAQRIALPEGKSAMKPFAQLSEDAKILVVKGSSFDVLKSTLVVPEREYHTTPISLDPFAEEITRFVLQISVQHHALDMPNLLKTRKVLSQGADLVKEAMSISQIIFEVFACWDDFAWLADMTSEPDHALFLELSLTEKMSRLTAVGDDILMHEYAESHSGDFKVFVTETGYLGVAAAVAEPGDRVVFLTNSPLPVILRPRGGHYTFRGFVGAWNWGLSQSTLSVRRSFSRSHELRNLGLMSLQGSA